MADEEFDRWLPIIIKTWDWLSFLGAGIASLVGADKELVVT